MTDTAIDKVLRPHEGQAMELLGWSFRELLPITADGDIENEATWRLEAIGVDLDHYESRLDKVYDLGSDDRHVLAHLIVSAAMWRPTERETYFLKSVMDTLMDHEVLTA